MPVWAPPLSAEMVMFLSCCAVLLLAAQLVRFRAEEPVVLRVAAWIRALSVVMIVGGVLQWLTDLPLAIALDSLRIALNTSLATISGVPITPVTLLSVVLIVLGSWLGSRWVQRALEKMLLARKIGDPGSIAALSRLVQYVVMGIGFAIGLETLGIDLGAFFTAGAVFAVGIGFAMQTIAENFVSGVILLVERTIRPGDILEVEGQRVRVVNMGIRSTLARSLDDEEIILPNANLVKNAVKNLKLSDNLLRVRVPVGVAYGSDLQVAMKALRKAAHSLPPVPKRPPVVLFKDFGPSSIDFEVSVWTENPWGTPTVRSDLGLAIWEALEEVGVEIAFPQLDVHLDAPLQS